MNLFRRIQVPAIVLYAWFAYVLTGHGQERNPRPHSDTAFIQETKDTLITSLKLRRPDTANPLEAELAAVVAKANRATGLVTELWICRGCGISSHPTLGIIVDVDQIAAIQKEAQAGQLSAVLAFLIGHEEAHQIQYQKYTARIIGLPETEREVYEAQADILGAEFLIESMKNDNSSQEEIVDALRVAYDLGVEQYAIADHPSQDQRLTASRLGMAAGMITKLRHLGGPPALASAEELARKIDFHSGESSLAWSLRTARRIVNYRRPDIINLVLVNRTINWDRNSRNPVVSYQLEYQNRGTTPLFVNAEVQCVAAPRDDRDDVFRWLKIDANSFAFTLQPGAIRTLSGTMHWYAGANLMPRIIVSPDPMALIEVSNPTGKVVGTETGADNSLAASTSSGFRATTGYWIARVITASASKFKSLRAGPGEKVGKFVVYPSDPQFPRSLRTRVWLPDLGSPLDPYVYAVVGDTSSSGEAQKLFTETVAGIRDALGEIGHWHETSSGNSSVEFTRANLRISIEDREDEGRFKVTVDVDVATE